MELKRGIVYFYPKSSLDRQSDLLHFVSKETELIILEVIWSWYFQENPGLKENADEVLH